jgi:hypothetical protein
VVVDMKEFFKNNESIFCWILFIAVIAINPLIDYLKARIILKLKPILKTLKGGEEIK